MNKLAFGNRFFPLLLVILILGCSSSKDKSPNILWISTEDISPALGAYGNSLVQTPNIDKLAEGGLIYRNAYVPSPICAPARSAIITGIQAATLGTQHLRSEIPLSEQIKTLPEYLQQAGYYTTNNRKTDYNFDFNEHSIWDESSGEAHWRNRPDAKPFFSVFNITITHEGNANNRRVETDSLLKQLKHRVNPDSVNIPPYLPDTDEMRRIWARYYDLIQVMDQKAGAILDQLEADGLTDDTIVMFWSDHGYGLPRYKRWPYKSGLNVPLIVHVPEKFEHVAEELQGSQSDRIINLVDLAPTVLNLAGADIPETMQGIPFMGPESDHKRDFMVATRSRADDVYDVSRTVIDDRYLYLRNYMPHKVWVQDAVIFSDDKWSYKELNRVKQQENLPPTAIKMFEFKPLEELYDLQEDPYETTNLAQSRSHRGIIQTMRKRLNDWILGTRDTGFLPESEMMIRSKNTTPYDMAQDRDQYHLKEILAMAENVGKTNSLDSEYLDKLDSNDSTIRYWALMGLLSNYTITGDKLSGSVAGRVKEMLKDASPAVQLTASELLCTISTCSDEALSVITTHLNNGEYPTVVLQAAITARRIGEKAAPINPVLKSVRAKYSGDTGSRGYKNWSYPMFIGFAVDQALENCGMPWENQ